MRRYKIIIGLVWACLVALSPVRGQAVVHDPVHMGSNLAGFGQQLEEALTQTQQFWQLISNTKEQWKVLDNIRNATEKVSKAIYMMQEVEDIATLAVHTIQSINDGVKIISSGQLQPYELQYTLELYTSKLRQVNTCIISTKRLVSDFKDAFGNETGMNKTEKEREEGIKEEKSKILGIAGDITDINFRIQKEVEMRENMAKMIKNTDTRNLLKTLSSIAGQAQPMDPEGVLDVPDKYDISTTPFPTLSFDETSFKPEIVNTANEKDIQTKYKTVSSPSLKLFYVISALVAVIGALRVLQIWNQGNDISKAIVAWGGTSVFLAIVGILVQLFFN